MVEECVSFSRVLQGVSKTCFFWKRHNLVFPDQHFHFVVSSLSGLN